MKNFLLIIVIVLMVPVFAKALTPGGSVCEIISTDRTIKIGNTVLLPSQAKGRKLSDKDSIFAVNGTANIAIKYGDYSGKITLPANKFVAIRDLETSSFCILEAKNVFTTIVSSIWNFFMVAHEDPKAYHKRYLSVIAGFKRGSEDDILDGKQYRTEMGKSDARTITRTHDSLRKAGVTDSAVYYLSDAVFFEQQNYLWKAYENYQNANNYLLKVHRPSPIVTRVFKEFLYRMGRFNEGDQLF